MSHIIKGISAREILASGAYPTIETTVILKSGAHGTASVPYGASAGSREASILIDNGKRYSGRGALKAVENVVKKIYPKLRNKRYKDQRALDEALIEIDPTPRKTKLGGNSILSVSLAFARAAARADSKELYKYVGEIFVAARSRGAINRAHTKERIPRPMMVIIEGGQHADNSTDFQEYLICPLKDIKYRESVRIGIEVYHAAKKILKRKKYDTNVGNEGAFAPVGIKSNEEPLKILEEAISNAGYKPGIDVGIAIDPAASEFYKKGVYYLKREKKKFSAGKLIEYYKRLVKKYPIISLEDGLAENDWDEWKRMYSALGSEILIIGDDITVSQEKYLQKGIDMQIMNTILIKPNQAGTLTETLDAIFLARECDINTVISHRGGGDTNDTFIMDLAVAAGSLFTKVGPSRGERVGKYNRMMEIADKLHR